MKASLFIVIIILTPCVTSAQGILSSNPNWVRTNLFFDPETLCSHEGFIFAGGEEGLYRSSNDGDTWILLKKGMRGDTDPPEINLLYPFGNYVLAKIRDWGIFRSSDNGDNWIRSAIPLSPYFLIGHKAYIFAYSGMIDRSSDSANTWELGDSGIVPRLPTGYHAQCYGLASTGNYLFTLNKDGQLYRSTTNGDYWDSIPSHYFLPAKYHLSLYGINDTTLFAGYGDSILRSTDYGMNWKVIKTGFGLSEIITYRNCIFAAGSGIIVTTDNGDSWRTASNGVLDTMEVVVLAIHNNFLFAGGYFSQSFNLAGLWRCPLSDLVNSVADNPLTLQQTPLININGGSAYIANIPDYIDKITFYNTAGQVFKVIKCNSSSVALPVKNSLQDFMEQYFLQKM